MRGRKVAVHEVKVINIYLVCSNLHFDLNSKILWVLNNSIFVRYFLSVTYNVRVGAFVICVLYFL